MSNLLNISSSPHVRSKTSTKSIMYDVLLALAPAALFGIFNFGIRALVLIVVCMASCVLSEYIWQKAMGLPLTVSDGSAALTGLFLALNLSSKFPIWMAIIGSVFAIIIVKQLFGGLGQNFMNPALGARCFLLIAFAADMTKFTDDMSKYIADGYTSATPLATLRNGGAVNTMDMLIGRTGGTIGETSAIFILLGAIFLILMGVIDLRIPASYIVTFVIFMLLFSGHGFDWNYITAQLCGGGLMLGAFFMATDYVTSPITPRGQIIFGICCGILTGLFRCFGANAEGVSFAIILSNILVPMIEKYTVPTAFGVVKEKKTKEGGK